MAVTEGTTVRDVLMRAVDDGILPADDLPRTLPRTTVMINGEALDRATALDRRLAAGDVVNIEVSEMGGGGGRKDVGQILLTIAVIVVSAWVGGAPGVGLGLKSVFLRAVASAAVMAAGNAAVAALFAPETAQAKVNDRFALQAASNQYRPWAPFPLALGEVIVAPDLAAKTYTQAIGDDVWIHGILAPHLGACEVSEIKIGDTLVSSMGSGDWRAVEHLTPGPRDFSIYPNDVDQLDLSEELEATTSTATAVVRATPSEGQRFELDFFLPAGLHFQKDDGRIIAATVTITIRHREIDAEGDPVGAGTWTTVTRTLTSTTKEPMRVTQPVTLPLGLYEFEVKRSVKPDGNAKRQDRLAWTALRCIAFRKPVVDETLSLIEFAVRASALNQGTLAPITCRIIPKVPTWDGEAWTAPVATSNPAALVRWLLTGPAAARPLSAEEADVRLRTWSTLCDDYGWTCNIYLADARTQAEALGLIGDAGRASLFWDGTQMAASPWVEKPAPRQLFAGDNLKDHRWKILYPEPVHALRVEYQNIDEGGEPDEVYVYADGYGETASEGIIAASLVEALRLEGQKTSERAYRDGRWELGRRLHQRRIDTWTTSIEHLVSGYGDRVRLAWQRLDGGAAVRVRTRRWSGELVSGLRLTEPVEMLPGESYVADLRLVDRVVTAVPIVNLADTAPVMTREISFLEARAEADCPRAGDKLAFGVATRVSEDVELIGIEPGEGLTASLTGIRYVAPLLIEGETADIPPLQTRLSRQRAANPPTPVLLGVQSDPAGVRISFAIPPWSGSPIVGFPARWRPTPAEDNDAGWLPLPAVSSTAGVLITPPVRALPGAIDDEEAATLIDIEIRAVTAAGQSSPVPLSVEGLVVREDPFVPLNLTVTPATRTAPDGSSHGVLVASVDALLAAVGTDVILEVRRYPPGGGAPEPWESAGLTMATTNPVGDILGLRAGTQYGVRAAFRSASGWPSDWTDEVVATVPAGSNVSGDVNPNSPAMLEVFYRQVDAVLESTLRIIEEQERRSSDTTDTQRFIDRIAVVNPTTGRVDLRSETVFAGRLSMASVDERVAEGIEGNGQIRQPVPRDVSELSGIYNEQIELTAEGELVINNPGGPVTGGQVVRVQEATGFLGHDAFVRRSPSDGNLGGRQFFEKPLINTTLTGDLAVDVYQSVIRFFDANNLYGVTLPISAFQPSIGGRIVVSTPAGIVAGDLGSTTALRAPAARIGNAPGIGYLTLVEGDATYSGRAEFFNAAGGRLGFVGLGTSATLIISAETGVNWAFDKRLDALAGAAVTGALTVSGLATLSGGADVTGTLNANGRISVLNGNEQRFYNVGNGNYATIKSPASGALSISTGGVSDAVYVANDGKVGVLTAAPEVALHVAGGIRARNGAVGFATLESGDATNTGYLAFNNAAGTRYGYMGLVNTTAKLIDFAAENGAAFYFHGGLLTAANGLAVAGGLTVGGSGSGRMLVGDPAGFGGNYTSVSLNNTTGTANYNFASSPSDPTLYINAPSQVLFRANNANVMMYNATGVGIGTVTPTEALHIERSASNPAIQLKRTGGTNNPDYKIVADETLGGLVFGRTGVANDAIFKNGNFGIGTTSPVSRAHFANAGTPLGFTFGQFSSALVTIGETNVGGSLFVNTPSLNGSFTSGLGIDGSYSSATSTVNIKAVGVQSGGGYGADLALHTSFEGSLYERARITKAGYFGIGTASPIAKLEVRQDLTGNPGFGQIMISGATNQAKRLSVGFDTTGDFAYLQAYENSVNYRSLALNPDGGKVGVNTTSPTEPMDVAGNILARGELRLRGGNGSMCGYITANSGTGGLYIAAEGGTNENIRLVPKGAGYVWATSDLLVSGSLVRVSGDHRFSVPAGQGFYFDVSGTGPVALLEATGRLSLNAITMGGLGLGEWTTWSPTPVAESGTATGLASVYAEVERHGKSVTVNFAVSQTAIGTGAAAILVPLPYAGKASRNFFGMGKNLNTGADLRVEVSGSNLRITAANSYPFGSGAESLAGSITYQCT